MIENYYFLHHAPKSVSPENLGRFVAAMPSLFRASLDALPAEEARRRLIVLYRLVYPHPTEMPAPDAGGHARRRVRPRRRLRHRRPPKGTLPAVSPPQQTGDSTGWSPVDSASPF